MLTTIPWKDFLELTKGVKEGLIKHPFKWDEMLETASYSYKALKTYLSQTNCKLIGEGSARTAFFLPPGSYDINTIEEPSCFKVVKNSTRGPAQNKAEVVVLKKYSNSKNYSCFPKLYNWDKTNYYFMHCEVGTPIDTMETNDIKSYFVKWNKWIEEHYPKYNRLRVFDPNDFLRALDAIFKVIHYNEDVGLAMKATIEEMTDEIHEYSGISDFLKFMFDAHGAKTFLYGDFTVADNWAVVLRNGEKKMIPIDWGFTREVADKYY